VAASDGLGAGKHDRRLVGDTNITGAMREQLYGVRCTQTCRDKRRAAGSRDWEPAALVSERRSDFPSPVLTGSGSEG
jgi:hypothetical protein